MGYGDYVPLGHHRKKPLSKKQLEEIKESYNKADEIIKHVRELEKKEKKQIEETAENNLNSIFL